MPDDPIQSVEPPASDLSGLALDPSGLVGLQGSAPEGGPSPQELLASAGGMPGNPQTQGMDTGGLQPSPQPNLSQLPPRPPGTSVASQPVDRKAYFREMLGNFLYSVGQGLSQQGTGPGATARGLGAAITAIPQRDVMLRQLAIQQEQAESARQLKEAQAASLTPSISMKDANGNDVLVPPAHVGQALAAGYRLAGQLGAAGIRAQSTQNVANTKAATETQKIASTEKIAVQKIEANKQLSADKLQMMREALADKKNYQQASLALRQAGFGMRQQEFAQKQEALSPQAQKVLIDTTPTHDQIRSLLEQFEPLKNDNTPLAHAADRAKYAIGISSQAGDAADQIAQLELNRVVAGARILKGSSRAIQALQLAMKHAPNVWVDSNKLIYDKLKNLDDALGQVEDAAYTYGKKTGVVAPANSAKDPVQALIDKYKTK